MFVRRVDVATIAILLLAELAGPLQGTAQAADETWRHKIAPTLDEAVSSGPIEFLVVVAAPERSATASGGRDETTRVAGVVQRLREQAATAQRPILDRLEAWGAEARPFWVANVIWVRAGRDVVETLAQRSDVVRIDANPVLSRTAPPEPDSAAAAGDGGVEWNVNRIGADQVWALGYDGTGAVIGSQDTGVFWEHPALKSRYRGWNGVDADHAYNWHDAIHVDTLAPPTCLADSTEPCDDGFFFPHGTYTMGISVGDDGATNQIGVSPGARWIGCRNSDLGGGTPASYIECFQWLVAPTDLDDANPDPTKAPHVINNSWACIPAEGCNPGTLQTVVDNVRAAGIVVAAAAGNDGAECETIDYPPAIYDSALTVGGTDRTDQIASTSSRGPVTIDGSDRMKPNLAAPGVNVRSAVGILDLFEGTVYYDYLAATGTSAAAPHVAGAVALLLDARPDLVGRVEEIETLLEASALPLTAAQPCGGIPIGETPNDVYGHGRLDVLELITGDADGDGTSNLEDCAPTDVRIWNRPPPLKDLRIRGGDDAVLTWTPHSPHPAAAVAYDVLRSTSPDDFTGATCLATHITETAAVDATTPDAAFYYLIRVENGCGTTAGESSAGVARDLPACQATN